MCLYYTMPSITVFTIKQLHDDTGPLVRQAGTSKRPIPVTDRGREVAVITNRSLLRPAVRKRTLLPEYEAMMAEAPGNDIQAALDEDRGTR
jgi:PHD/YefM family antitoxin component YafN of YafNO toxin-antitoxin module